MLIYIESREMHVRGCSLVPLAGKSYLSVRHRWVSGFTGRGESMHIPLIQEDTGTHGGHLPVPVTPCNIL
jgi:hypothetical protein